MLFLLNSHGCRDSLGPTLHTILCKEQIATPNGTHSQKWLSGYTGLLPGLRVLIWALPLNSCMTLVKLSYLCGRHGVKEWRSSPVLYDSVAVGALLETLPSSSPLEHHDLGLTQVRLGLHWCLSMSVSQFSKNVECWVQHKFGNTRYWAVFLKMYP